MTKQFKRLLALLLCLAVLSGAFVGCAQKGDDQPIDTPAATDPVKPDDSETKQPEETSAPEETDAPETTPPTQDASSHTVSETTTEAAATEPPEVTTEETATAAPETTVTTTAETTVSTAATIQVDPASGIMYAQADVNVRSGPDAGFERLGHLDGGDDVEITGIAANGWYRIKFKGGEGFVSGKYLDKTKPAVVTTAATTAATTAKIEKQPEKKDEEVKEIKNEKWISTWGTAMLTAGADQTPKNPALANNTVRQQIRVSVGGNKIKLVLSNEFGKSGLEIKSIKIAKLDNPKDYKIDLKSEKALTYESKASFTVPAGKRITTDELDFEFDALDDLAITIKLGSVPSVLTCHTASRCSTWIVKGDHVSDNNYSGFEEMTSWYFITRLDTMSSKESGVIVCLGDSLTDGASVRTNGFSRYSDELSRRLRKDDKLNNLAVVNMGIGATALYAYGNDSGKNRLQRDVLDTPGVKYCVLMYGVNDIGGANSDISSNIINEYKSIIEKCHKKGVKVYGCTITPFKGSGYYSELHEKIRKKVNEFILSEDSGFDGCIDTSTAVASGNDPLKINLQYVSVWNDNLHFNDAGYKFVGKTIYEHIAKFIEEEN